MRKTTNAGPAHPRARKSAGLTRAARRMNSDAISRTRRFSLNSTMCLTGTARWLARNTPIRVTVKSPDSASMRFEAVKAPATSIKRTGLCRKSGTQKRRRTITVTSAPRPPTSAPPRIVYSICMPISRRAASKPAVEAAGRASYTRTASAAPIGSMTIPSQWATRATVPTGRTWRSSGPTTVGPVTTTIAPSRRAVPAEKPRSRSAAQVAMAQVMSAPTVTRLQTEAPIALRSRARRLSPPSKRINPTERETRGKRSSPNSASGSIKPVTGPATKPTASSRRMDGTRSRHASHWAPTPRTAMPARPTRTCSS
jgi:hypothetical protein